MSKKNITVHMIVKNEDRFIWYAIQSVLPYVDKFIIYDTGSKDNTISIIKSIKNKKIFFSQVNISSKKDISQLRQKQLDETKTDWIWIVDGDEIYSPSLCKEIEVIINSNAKNIEGIVVRRYDLIGDIYHYQKESVGAYNLFGEKGHIVIRLLNKSMIKGLHVDGIYPYEGYYDKTGKEIIHHNKAKYCFTNGKLFHAMYLKRSTRGEIGTYNRNKFKIERGIKLESIPEIFFRKYSNVPFISKKRSIFYELVSEILTPLKEFKRKIIY